jgi:ATP-dependent exoDNAse (exonuclease V) beta subunit
MKESFRLMLYFSLAFNMFGKERYQGREDDERRLFYVAMTRARELLVLSWFSQHAHSASRPSRFVQELVKIAKQGELARAGACKPFVPPKGPSAEPVLETDFSKLVTFSELLGNASLMNSLKRAESPEEALHNALKMATERGTIISIVLDSDGASEDIYFQNTESNRQIATKVQNGEIKLGGLKAKSD